VIALDLARIGALTGGRLVGGADGAQVVTGPVVVDSRRVAPGALFVCIRGERVDGHEFARAALDAGAAAVLATHDTGTPAVVVDDAQQALAALATGVLDLAGCRVVGVTGSSGKTSTKDLLAAVFGHVGPTVAAEGSFNNELGLPLTALRVSADTQTLVLEYSARGIGHIRYLCGIARPDIAVVLNVGHAHLGEFGSRDAIATAKGELVEAVGADGHAVLNADDPLVAAMAHRTSAQVMTFGADEGADVRVCDVVLDRLARPRFRLLTPAGAADVTLRVHGRHQAFNAAAAVAAGLAAGVELDDAVAALASTSALSPHRMQLCERDDGLVVLDDAYNANPDSVRAALHALTGIAAGARRSWAVLGAMRELGEESDALHASVGAAAAQDGVDELLVVGADAAAVADGARRVSGWRGRVREVADADAAAALLRAEASGDDAVLVKASNSEQLWRVADALLAETPAALRDGATA
jgi:UDP-N-acetylmuramoyl-tripeptide--D-alanyl-D-alanine ligase